MNFDLPRKLRVTYRFLRILEHLRINIVIDAFLRLFSSKMANEYRAWTRKIYTCVRYRHSLVAVDTLLKSQTKAFDYLKNDLKIDELGDYLEFGVCHGRSIACMAKTLAEQGLNQIKIYGFDSFEGLPASKDESDGKTFWQESEFPSDIEFTKFMLTKNGINWDQVHLEKGWFSDTLTPQFLDKHSIKKASVIMVDCDIYLSAKQCLEFSAQLIKDHAILFFDDWFAFEGQLAQKNMGEKRAFDEFMADHPEFISKDLEGFEYNSDSKTILVSRI